MLNFWFKKWKNSIGKTRNKPLSIRSFQTSTNTKPAICAFCWYQDPSKSVHVYLVPVYLENYLDNYSDSITDKEVKK